MKKSVKAIYTSGLGEFCSIFLIFSGFVVSLRPCLKWYFWNQKWLFTKQSRHWKWGVIIGLTKAIIIHLPEALVPAVGVCTCARERVLLACSLWRAVPVLGVSSVLCLACLTEPCWAGERGRERDLWTMCWSGLFHNTGRSVQATGTAVWSTAPKEQLGTTLRLCDRTDLFPHLAAVVKRARSHACHFFCAFDARRSPAPTWLERLISPILTPFNAKGNGEKSRISVSCCQGARLRHSGVSGRWDLPR